MIYPFNSKLTLAGLECDQIFNFSALAPDKGNQTYISKGHINSVLFPLGVIMMASESHLKTANKANKGVMALFELTGNTTEIPKIIIDLHRFIL